MDGDGGGTNSTESSFDENVALEGTADPADLSHLCLLWRDELGISRGFSSTLAFSAFLLAGCVGFGFCTLKGNLVLLPSLSRVLLDRPGRETRRVASGSWLHTPAKKRERKCERRSTSSQKILLSQSVIASKQKPFHSGRSSCYRFDTDALLPQCCLSTLSNATLSATLECQAGRTTASEGPLSIKVSTTPSTSLTTSIRSRIVGWGSANMSCDRSLVGARPIVRSWLLGQPDACRTHTLHASCVISESAAHLLYVGLTLPLTPATPFVIGFRHFHSASTAVTTCDQASYDERMLCCPLECCGCLGQRWEEDTMQPQEKEKHSRNKQNE